LLRLSADVFGLRERKKEQQNSATYIGTLLSLELGNSLIGSGGVGTELEKGQRIGED
jgi:hypothetical protein